MRYPPPKKFQIGFCILNLNRLTRLRGLPGEVLVVINGATLERRTKGERQRQRHTTKAHGSCIPMRSVADFTPPPRTQASSKTAYLEVGCFEGGVGCTIYSGASRQRSGPLDNFFQLPGSGLHGKTPHPFDRSNGRPTKQAHSCKSNGETAGGRGLESWNGDMGI